MQKWSLNAKWAVHAKVVFKKKEKKLGVGDGQVVFAQWFTYIEI